MRVSSLSGDVEGEGFPCPLPSAPRPPPPPHLHPIRKGRGAGPSKAAVRARSPGFRKQSQPKRRDRWLSAAPPRGRELGAQSRSRGGRGRAQPSAPSVAPPGAAGVLDAPGTRAALRPGLGGVRHGAARRGWPAHFPPRSLGCPLLPF